jgi:hypothetical protein
VCCCHGNRVEYGPMWQKERDARDRESSLLASQETVPLDSASEIDQKVNFGRGFF